MTQADRRSKIVLAADDETENIRMLGSLIEGAGYTFMAASNGLECIALAIRAQPRLILLDIQMSPGIDGFVTCGRLRALPDLRRVPVLFLTGRKSPEDIKKCLEAGGNDFIVKPFDPGKLMERVEYWTGRRVDQPAPQQFSDGWRSR